MKIQAVGPKRHLSDPIPVFLAERLAWILRFRAVEPLALIVGIENFAADQRPHPGGEIIGGGDDATGRQGIGRILPCVVVGLKRVRPGRSYEIGGIRRIRQGVGGTAVQITVCIGRGNGVRGAGREQGVLHTKRPEEAILKNSGQRRAFNLLGDETEQRIIGVAVVVFRSRSEDGRMFECDGEQFVRGPNPGRVLVETFGKLAGAEV